MTIFNNGFAKNGAKSRSLLNFFDEKKPHIIKLRSLLTKWFCDFIPFRKYCRFVPSEIKITEHNFLMDMHQNDFKS